MAIQATQIRSGMTIIHNGQPHKVLDFHHHTPGNLRAMVQTKLRNLKSGVLTSTASVRPTTSNARSSKSTR